MGPLKKAIVAVGQPRPFLLPRVVEWLVNVVHAALLCFSSLHLCRISKLLWCTGCCRKLKLSTLFKTAQAAASSCPWRSKTHREKRTEKGGGTGEDKKKTGEKRRQGGRQTGERKREKRQIRWQRRGDEEMQSSTCARLLERWLAFTNCGQTVAAGGSLSLCFCVQTQNKLAKKFWKHSQVRRMNFYLAQCFSVKSKKQNGNHYTEIIEPATAAGALSEIL